jgi:toxin ParE1/3/4
VDLEVKWSPEATEDLESIAEYIARDSEYYARAVATEILSVSRSLPEFPAIGRIVPEIGDEYIRDHLRKKVTLFAAAYLLWHGVVKVRLVAAILLKRRCSSTGTHTRRDGTLGNINRGHGCHYPYLGRVPASKSGPWVFGGN